MNFIEIQFFDLISLGEKFRVKRKTRRILGKGDYCKGLSYILRETPQLMDQAESLNERTHLTSLSIEIRKILVIKIAN